MGNLRGSLNSNENPIRIMQQSSSIDALPIALPAVTPFAPRLRLGLPSPTASVRVDHQHGGDTASIGSFTSQHGERLRLKVLERMFGHFKPVVKGERAIDLIMNLLDFLHDTVGCESAAIVPVDETLKDILVK